MSTGYFAHGTKLKLGNAATPTETFAEIPLAGDISVSRPDPDKIPIPDHSDSTGYKKFITGLKGSGTITVTLSYSPVESTHVALHAAHGTVRNFQLVPPSPGAKAWQFSALISMPEDFPEAKEWAGKLKLESTGTWSEVTP
jgi:hypothetical protein